MARLYVVPARYAPEMEAAVRAAERSIKADAQMRTGPDAPFPGGMIPREMIDESRTGALLVVIAELPADNALPVFLTDHLLFTAGATV